MYKLEELNSGTIFNYAGRTYKKGFTFGPNPNREDLKDYTQGVQCSPKLGGVFQTKIEVWLPLNTDVDVY